MSDATVGHAGLMADEHGVARDAWGERCWSTAEGALREAMTDVLAVAEVDDERAPAALLDSLAELGWALQPTSHAATSAEARWGTEDIHGGGIEVYASEAAARLDVERHPDILRLVHVIEVAS